MDTAGKFLDLFAKWIIRAIIVCIACGALGMCYTVYKLFERFYAN